MAPPSLALLPRQFGTDDRDGDRDGNGPFADRGDSGVSRWTILGIVIAVLVVAGILGLVFFRRMRHQRRGAVSSAINLASTPTSTGHKLTSNGPSGNGNGNGNGNGPPKYGASTTGYGVSPDQNQSLLGNAEGPAIVMWGPPPHGDGDNAGSTQDGFGYDNNLQLAGTGTGMGIQRPASVASFSAPPPRYEEATDASAGRPQGQGEAASYFNAAVPMLPRSQAGGAPAERPRGRALSVDTRSLNGERRRSMSRFTEDGMVDVNVGVNANSEKI
ncbi:hypothetical protein A1O7_00305 [Cladophialophora yegresii CBS 114405]|uniref:Uncharacterized protein n=1 Tax=Cladophialophora yegresii CBS 114405 TaxID=1182544 RepID=W9WG51_9EURO|nr:uncharacterized protein A1O7_00305 [Cladophialophora yegresii CBS 114405]EXJ63970.1 hypothetical protein A1O7_00305 [Cladophialophora yegresii CBS 114405]